MLYERLYGALSRTQADVGFRRSQLDQSAVSTYKTKICLFALNYLFLCRLLLEVSDRHLTCHSVCIKVSADPIAYITQVARFSLLLVDLTRPTCYNHG